MIFPFIFQPDQFEPFSIYSTSYRQKYMSAKSKRSNFLLVLSNMFLVVDLLIRKRIVIVYLCLETSIAHASKPVLRSRKIFSASQAPEIKETLAPTYLYISSSLKLLYFANPYTWFTCLYSYLLIMMLFNRS